MTNLSVIDVSIVIPTYGREEVLLATIDLLLCQTPGPRQLLIVDQTEKHAKETEARLIGLHDQGRIRWIRLTEPSIPKAMNRGLDAASEPIVLFLDDDITCGPDLVRWHQKTHADYPDAVAVVGQVLQPGESPVHALPRGRRDGLRADFEFPFYSSRGDWIANVMAGNLSVKREYALQMGGFDENFVGVAYRFETEFARRITKRGGKIRFCPEASIHHLRASKGGTRATGSHLTSASPKYGVGDHYYAFLHGGPVEAWGYAIKRVVREVRTKFHLTHPWWIPVKLVGELRAMWQGWRMAKGKRPENSC